MKIKNRIAISVLVQFYEVEIIGEYLKSLKLALEEIENPENVLIDICFNTSQALEKIDKKQISLNKIKKKFYDTFYEYFPDYHFDTPKNIYRWEYSDDKVPYTIADYRRDFNNKYCDKVDILMWGETDALIPHNTFQIIDNLHIQSLANNIPKYIATFGICKMWDDSWKSIEHTEFTDKPFIVNDYSNWWSLKYTMTLEEMNKFNYKVEELDVRMTTDLKFNGCGLVISSDIIKAGVNIPKAVWFVHEDSSFMLVLQKMLSVPQYIIKNILIVHNRNHPKKRMYVKEGEGETLNLRRRTNPWYVHANKMCEHNAYNLFNQSKIYTWEDVWEAVKNEK